MIGPSTLILPHLNIDINDLKRFNDKALLSQTELDFVKKYMSENQTFIGEIPVSTNQPLLTHTIVIGSNQNPPDAYALYKEQGSGCYGAVFLSQHIFSNEWFAIKKQKLSPGKRRQINDIQNENQALAELGQLQTSFEISNADNTITFYSVMHLGQGDNLDPVIFNNDTYGTKQPSYDIADRTISDNERNLRLLSLLEIANEMLREVSEIHSKGYINRDIKIPNFLWDTKKKAAKLIDQGFALKLKSLPRIYKKFEKNVNNKDLLSLLSRGTPPYMAPEIWCNHIYSIASDIYALGVSLAELFNCMALGPDCYDIEAAIPSILEHKEDRLLPKALSWGIYDEHIVTYFKGLPDFVTIIKEMMHPNKELRPSIQSCIEVFSQARIKLLEKMGLMTQANFVQTIERLSKVQQQLREQNNTLSQDKDKISYSIEMIVNLRAQLHFLATQNPISAHQLLEVLTFLNSLQIQQCADLLLNILPDLQLVIAKAQHAALFVKPARTRKLSLICEETIEDLTPQVEECAEESLNEFIYFASKKGLKISPEKNNANRSSSPRTRAASQITPGNSPIKEKNSPTNSPKESPTKLLTFKFTSLHTSSPAKELFGSENTIPTTIQESCVARKLNLF